MSLTADQLAAIAARGNVVVMAGAGTGKTRTLVERCLDCLLKEKPRASLEELLLVTFTEAAATEMRQRIRDRLKSEAERDPGDRHWAEQLALFETARIGTLHSFCFQLVRQHFYQLGLDPQLTVLAEEEARLLAEESLTDLLQKHYAGRGSEAEAVQNLLQAQGRGWDKPVRALVLRLHHYTQTLPAPAGWLREQMALFAAPEPVAWRAWLGEAIGDWRARWLPALQTLGPANEVAAQCAAVLERLRPAAAPAEASAVLETLRAADRDCPRGKRALWVQPLKEFLEEARFLSSLTPAGAALAGAGMEPLAQDWAWVRSHMTTLLKLAADFTTMFTETKRELGVADFHDLEQCALRLLWDPEAGQPTALARQWRQQLRFVFVDEYQDINAAQDKIIEALSREGAQANRFLVGDVKQSIYRFRLANPHIFQGYLTQWAGGAGTVLALTENFRSRERILNFINSLFSRLMRPELGGVAYDEAARLRFGAPGQRQPLSAATGSEPAVELQLRLKGESPGADPEGERGIEPAGAAADLRDLEEAAKDAHLVARRLRELKASAYLVWAKDRFQPVEWRDMAVLLRSPARKAESYAKEFARLGVPLLVERTGFYESLEISDLLSLLQVLDNPLQDLPLLAVLRSPLVGLTLEELGTIRLTAPKGRFWTALSLWHQDQVSAPGLDAGQKEAARKVSLFLERFAKWRQVARQVSLSRCLEAVLGETHYVAWLMTQPRGDQREANVQRLLALAQQFDQFQRQGLFRFLRFIEAQQAAETEPEVPAVSAENAVRLMSIHQSKGLEFPVVVVADIGKAFNFRELRAELILDDRYGLCPQILPPHTGKRYPSLPYWLARRRQAGELLGEELRLLYVAMTRARDLLLLSGGVARTRFERRWQTAADPAPGSLSAARSYADWLAIWFSENIDATQANEGEQGELRWIIHDEAAFLNAAPDPAESLPAAESHTVLEPAALRQLQEKLSWQYPFAPATRQPAKTSVSALRRQAALADDEESAPILPDNQLLPPDPLITLQYSPPPEERAGARRPQTSATVGTAHHTFLQFVDIDHTTTPSALQAEAQRLAQAGRLRAEEAALLDYDALAAFWNSALGQKVRANARFAERELAFTARFSPTELARFTGTVPDSFATEEFVVVQGVADLVLLLPRELWLLDFKTDRLAPHELTDRIKAYEPQLKLYAHALSRIYHRPVGGCWLYFLARQQAVAVNI